MRPFRLRCPARSEGEPWERLLDTADPHGEPVACPAGQPYALQGRSMVVLRTAAPPQEESATRGDDDSSALGG